MRKKLEIYVRLKKMARKLKLLDLFGALFKLKEQCIDLLLSINGEMLKDYGKIVELKSCFASFKESNLQRIGKTLQRNSLSEREYLATLVSRVM